MYETKFKEFRRQDKLIFESNDINLFVGSSSFRRWVTLSEDMSPKKVLNRGFGGSKMSELLEYYDDLIKPYKFAAIFIYEGDNDLVYKKISPENVFKDYLTIVEKIHAQCPKAMIYFVSIKCSPKRFVFCSSYKILNNLIEKYSKTNEYLNFIDINSKMFNEQNMPNQSLFNDTDKIHPNEAGYKLMTKIIKPYLFPSDS